MVNFNHLYYFHAAVAEGSISAGARRLKISQPALSHQIKKLEESLGLNLFIRHGRRVRITPAGKTLFQYSSKMFSLAEECLVSLKRPARANRLRLGVCEEIERPFTARLASRAVSELEMEPPVVKVISGTHSQLLAALQAHRLDAILSDRPPVKGTFHALGVLSMPVFLVARRSSTEPAHPRMEKVLEKGLALPSARFRLRAETERFMARRALKSRTVFESDLLASVVRAVEDGVGAGFLPLAYLLDSVDRSRLSVLGPPGGYWKYPIWLLSALPPGEEQPLLLGLRAAFVELGEEVDHFHAQRSIGAVRRASAKHNVESATSPAIFSASELW